MKEEDRQHITFMEGCDMVGKTQIAQALAHRIGAHYFKASSEHDTFLSSRKSKSELFLQQLRYADPRMFDFLQQTGISVVFDRGFPSEFVYSRVMKRETDHLMLDHMDQMWSSLGARVVICYRTSYAGIVDDLDPSIDEKMLQRLTEEYFEWADKQTTCEVLKLCVDDEDLEREVGEIVRFLGVGS